MNVIVYGGGNIAHSLAGVISRHQLVTVITRQPDRWNERLAVEQSGTVWESTFPVIVSSDCSQIASADLVLVALPQFAMEDAVAKVLKYTRKSTAIAFVPAPAKAEDYASRLMNAGLRVIGFQRVPYISRTIEYGRRVCISTDRENHRIAFSDSSLLDLWPPVFSRWFGGSVTELSSFALFAFSNSNPLLHPARMVVLFNNWRAQIYPTNPPFYAEWTDESSELYVAADREMRAIMSAYLLEREHEDVLTHYGVKTTSELTAKIRNIPSFKSILSPMRQEGGRWVPDFDSRYFAEDVPYGLMEIVRRGRLVRADMPVLEQMVHKMDEIVCL